MPKSSSPVIPFRARSTADDVLAGLDLGGKTILVTGCNSGLGFETMRAFAAHGAHVVGLARSEESARAACARVKGATPIACDLSDLTSVAAAAEAVRKLGLTLDAIVANAGMMAGRQLELVNGIEKQFFVNHVAHFLLINRLIDLVPDGTGRVVMLSSDASIRFAPKRGIMFDNLDGHRKYKTLRFYGQSKLATALFASELSRRLSGRGIAVNSVHPGVVFSTRLLRNLGLASRSFTWAARRFVKSIPQGAATQVLLAGSPLVSGITGEFWRDCQISRGSPHLADQALAARVWSVTEEILTRAGFPSGAPDQNAPLL